MLPSQVDKYRIVRLLGEGGMGQVYEAVDDSVGRRAAIKTLRAELTGDGEMLARFRNEARALMTVRHSCLVEIYGTGMIPGGAAYIAMEFVDGQSLRRLLTTGHTQLGLAICIARQVAEVLAVVHQHGIIHRDLKPENVLILREGSRAGGSASAAAPQIKVIDFGIAKVTRTTQTQTQLETRTGVVMGTPLYMAPEQCGGDGEISDRTDVYALGCLMYELVTGHPPFQGETDRIIIGKHLFQKPLPLRQSVPDASGDLELLVHAMLAKEPAQRPPMSLIASALEQMSRGRPLSQAATKMLRLAREAETVRYREARTAELGNRRSDRTSTLLLAVLAALLLALLALAIFRRPDTTRPATAHNPAPVPATNGDAPHPPPMGDAKKAEAQAAPTPSRLVDSTAQKKTTGSRPASNRGAAAQKADSTTAGKSPASKQRESQTAAPKPTKQRTKNSEVELM